MSSYLIKFTILTILLAICLGCEEDERIFPIITVFRSIDDQSEDPIHLYQLTYTKDQQDPLYPNREILSYSFLGELNRPEKYDCQSEEGIHFNTSDYKLKDSRIVLRLWSPITLAEGHDLNYSGCSAHAGSAEMFPHLNWADKNLVKISNGEPSGIYLNYSGSNNEYGEQQVPKIYITYYNATGVFGRDLVISGSFYYQLSDDGTMYVGQTVEKSGQINLHPNQHPISKVIGSPITYLTISLENASTATLTVDGEVFELSSTGGNLYWTYE